MQPMDSTEHPLAFENDARTCACCGQALCAPTADPFGTADPLAAARSDDGIFQRMPEPELGLTDERRVLVFHPVAVSKVLVLYVSTLGFYSMFWAHRNWRLLRDHTGQDLSPFWRSLFSRLWGFVLFREVRDDALSRGIPVSWRGGWLGLLYLALGMAWRLDGPASLVGLSAILPILVVQHTINRVSRDAGVQPDATYSVWHLPLIALGPHLLALIIYGTFFFKE
jgi:hypothetical protein